MVRALRHFLGSRPVGVWLALFAIAVAFLLVGGQVLSLVDWDLAIRLGLQENDPNASSPVERVLAHIEWGVCAADALVVLPLFVLAFVGVGCRRFWGVACAFGATAVWVYAVAFYSLQRYSLAFRGGLVEWGRYQPIIVTFAVAVLLPSLLLVLGLMANLDRFLVVPPPSRAIRRKTDALPPSLLEDFLTCAGQVLLTIPKVWIGKRMSWNTRHGETTRRMAGDERIEDGIAVDRAITIRRPPQDVWPWIAQFGRGAAYYSWDFLDNAGHRQADYLLGTTEPAVGDWNEALGEIVHVESGKEIVWHSEPDFMGIRTPTAMVFRVDPEPNEATRVHYRMSFHLPQTSLRARIALRVGVLLDHVMSTEMLRRLKLLVETYEGRIENGETNRSLAPHQKTPWRPAA